MSKLDERTENRSFIDKYAKIIVAFSVLCGAMSGPLASLISAPAIVIGFWRLMIALPFFAIPTLAKKESRYKLKAVSGKSLVLSGISGIFLFLHFFCWLNAVKMTNVASAAVLASLHPLVVLLVTVFIYKKKVSWKSVAAIFAALCGGAVIMCSDLSSMFSGGQFEGNLLAFGAAVFMGAYFAVGGKVRQEVDGSIYVLLVFTACAICFVAANVITGTSVIGYPSTDYLYMICLALLCQIGAHAMFNMCMGHVSSLYVSTWEAGDPVFSTLIAIVVVKQIPTVIEIVGCVIVVSAVLIYNKFEREAAEK